MPLTKVDAQLVGGAITTDSSGNVGINVTPSAWSLAGGKAIQLSNTTALWNYANESSYFSNNHYFNGSARIFLINGYSSEYIQTGGQHVWSNSNASGTAGNSATMAERMRIDSSGNLLINSTTSYASEKFLAKCTTNAQSASFVQAYSASNSTNVYFAHSFASGGNSGTQCNFLNSSGSTVGSINSTGSATSYVTSSDYRLKENIAPMTGALDKVQALKPVTYDWKNGGSSQGFIAHELQEVVPEAVVGEKDAVNEDGTIKPQGIDTSFLVATLTAAIQELKAELDATKAEVQALKAGV